MLASGSPAPEFSLTNQLGAVVALSGLRGRRVLVFFYPKASTPGCTQQACGLRDIAGAVDGTMIVGISPDSPAAQRKFADKFNLGYDLLADTDHVAAEAYGVWQEKNMYGKKYMGIVRSAFLVDGEGSIEQAWYKVSPADTAKNLLKAVAK
jgi:thioredoxin-dependent peroxiredoxin